MVVTFLPHRRHATFHITLANDSVDYVESEIIIIYYKLPLGYSMLCILLLNSECGILHAIFTKFHRLFNASAAHVQTYIAIATYTVCIIYTCVYNMYAAGTRTRMVIADMTLDASSGLQLHGVVGNIRLMKIH